ncbi:MAG: iron-sulfur cluster assembly scaffold protein [Candidatus Paceibacterota bacterium]|jgi:nitrogen fixation NifU-like protein
MKQKDIYSKEIMKYFLKPKNVGVMKNYDGLGKVGNPVCGDVLWLYIKVGVDKNGEKTIKDVKFQTLGCAVAIANSSVLTEMIKGKPLKQAMKLTQKDLIKKLGNVPPLKIHCSFLAMDALKEAINDYESKKK